MPAYSFHVVLLLLAPCEALRLPFVARRAMASVSAQMAFAQTASPFALSETFASDVFEAQAAQLELFWPVEVDSAKLEDLVQRVQDSTLGAALRITTRQAKDGYRLIAAGPRAGLNYVIELATRRNLVPAASVWS